MSTRETQFSIHPALGGLDVSSDASVLDPNFLTVAQNIEYLEGGQRRKRSGTAVYSTGLTSTGTNTYLASSSGAIVRSLADFWRYGTALSPTQHLMNVASKSIYYSTGNGAWVAASATSSFGSSGSTRTTITLAGDYAVINDGDPLSTSPPVAWDQTTLHTFTSSGGSGLPIYTGAAYHLNRLFTGGLSTAPSQVNYTAANSIFDSTGGDTGGFTVDVGDGDQVMGLSKTFYGSIYIFKGPQFGSVHQLSGNDAASFALAKVAHGAPLLNPRAVISTPTDIFWISNYGVHSLQTTVKFGNVEEAFLSLPIQRLWRDRVLDRQALSKSWGFWVPERSLVGWAVAPTGGAQRQTWMLVYNYALSDPKPGGKKFWAIWLFPWGVTSGATILVPTGWPLEATSVLDPHPWFGTDIAQVMMGGRDAAEGQYNDAGDPISMSIQTPVITRYPSPSGATPETQEKQHTGVVTYFFPYAGGTTATLTVTIDRRVQTYTVDLTGGGARLDIDFILDTSTLGGGDFNYFETIIEDRGRSITLKWDQTGLNQVMELFGYSVRYYPAEATAKEQV